MARRIFEIAKELGVESKAIVAKCHAEGISEAVVKNHMSSISVGLEATIKEWFGPHSSPSMTAVETADKVDLGNVRNRTARKRARSGPEGGGDEDDAAHHSETSEGDAGETPAVATPASPVAPVAGTAPAAVQATPAAQAAPVQAAPVDTHARAQAIPATGIGGPTRAAAIAPSTPSPAAGTGSAAQPPRTTAPPMSPAAVAAVTAAPPLTPAAGGAPAAAGGASGPATPARPPLRSYVIPKSSISTTPPAPTPGRPSMIASARPGAVTPPAPTPEAPVPADDVAPGADQDSAGEGSAGQGSAGQGSGQGSSGSNNPRRPSAPGTAGGPGGTTRPLPGGPPRVSVNVPTRPTSIAPAGPKLENRAPVKLSGPRVVRVEAPENIQAPRPRRVGPPSGPGGTGPRPGGGAGPGGATTGGDDDRGRSPRRKTDAPKRSTGAGVPDRRRARTGPDWVGSTQGIFSEQDLIEREARLARAGGFLKKRKNDLKKPGAPGSRADEMDDSGAIRIAAPFTIKDLSAATGVKAADIVKKLFLQGVMAKINDGIDPTKAQEIMMDFEIELEVVAARTAEESIGLEFEAREAKDIRSRGPVVTILGHVDHGKTSLLDKIRNANVAAGEAGGITQRTSAFRVPVTVAGETKDVVFLDTPGHEAFTSMRSRGANMTDVIVLVVSAPEGVMPQTIESINHAKAANVPMVVALNKIDRPDATEAQVQRTLGELAKAGLNPIEWGGDTEVVRTSAVSGVGIPELLETLDYQSQLRNLKADFGGPARGTVIEARTEEGRGSVASILVQQGKLKVGDFIVAGRAFGRVRDITTDKGERPREASPPMPVMISGLDEVPDAGDKFYVVDSLKKAEEAAEQRRHRERQVQLAQPKVTLDSLFTQMTDTDVKEIKIVLKAAEQGTVDVLKAECEKVGTSEVKVRVLHAGIGGITESDVVLADASKAIIVGFNVIPSGKARGLSETKGVEIRTYQVIYDITDDLKKAAEGMLSPDIREELLGHAEVRAVFRISKVGSIAGCYVTDGTVQRDALIRVTRNGVVVENDRKLAQLKRLKDDAKEVRAGVECGMKIDGYDDIKEGDILECYRKVEVRRTLGGAPEAPVTRNTAPASAGKGNTPSGKNVPAGSRR